MSRRNLVLVEQFFEVEFVEAVAVEQFFEAAEAVEHQAEPASAPAAEPEEDKPAG